MAAFEELGLLPQLVTAAERAGWRYAHRTHACNVASITCHIHRLPTPIQAEAIPLILGGKQRHIRIDTSAFVTHTHRRRRPRRSRNGERQNSSLCPTSAASGPRTQAPGRASHTCRQPSTGQRPRVALERQRLRCAAVGHVPGQPMRLRRWQRVVWRACQQGSQGRQGIF